jgi:hypothetical protein
MMGTPLTMEAIALPERRDNSPTSGGDVREDIMDSSPHRNRYTKINIRPIIIRSYIYIFLVLNIYCFKFGQYYFAVK